MKRVEVRFAGFGGQGVVLAGVLLARAAALYEGLRVVQTQSYGAEARGGAARSEVVISDEPIDYPMVLEADALVAMSQPGLDRYIGDLKPDGFVIVDKDLVPRVPRLGRAKLFKVPARKVAEEELGKGIAANTIMLGALVALTGIVSEGAATKAVERGVPEGTVALNLKALKVGLDLGRRLRGEGGRDEPLRV